MLKDSINAHGRIAGFSVLEQGINSHPSFLVLSYYVEREKYCRNKQNG